MNIKIKIKITLMATNYIYEFKGVFPTLPFNVRDNSELIQRQYISGITPLVKSIYSLLTSTENYELKQLNTR
jgi:hypothetical protein